MRYRCVGIVESHANLDVPRDPHLRTIKSPARFANHLYLPASKTFVEPYISRGSLCRRLRARAHTKLQPIFTFLLHSHRAASRDVAPKYLRDPKILGAYHHRAAFKKPLPPRDEARDYFCRADRAVESRSPVLRSSNPRNDNATASLPTRPRLSLSERHRRQAGARSRVPLTQLMVITRRDFQRPA